MKLFHCIIAKYESARGKCWLWMLLGEFELKLIETKRFHDIKEIMIAISTHYLLVLASPVVMLMLSTY
jgi:hypothetical protein